MLGGARFSDWLDTPARADAALRAVERARALEPRLHAFVTLALSAHTGTAGPLAGMPYAAKDMFASEGRQPTCGLGHGIDLGFAGNAEVLRRLDHAGGVRVGFTTMTELAYEPSGYNACQAPARNPWNADFIPGGSSSGSAVAVASGSVVFALGSDTGGSVRIPAHACGVTAWKPGAGRVSVQGAMALAPTLDTVGLIARSAADMSVPAEILLEGAPRNVPIIHAVVLADVLETADADVRVACSAAIAAIEACGVTLARRNAIAAIRAVDAHALVVLQGEAARVHRRHADDATLEPMLQKRLAKGLLIDDPTLAASVTARGALSARFLEQVFAGADAALLPVMPIRTPPCAVCDPVSPNFDARTLYRLSEWTRFVNLLGYPAVALPAGFDQRGMPVALQIVGRPGMDMALIELVRTVQEQTDWHGRVPVGLTGP